MKPISPNEITSAKKDQIPDEVIQSVNEMIVEKWNGYESTFKQKDLVIKIVEKLIEHELYNSEEEKKQVENRLKRNLFDKHYLDIEDIYREEGWIIIYDKPGYNESYDATFTFKRRSNTVAIDITETENK